MSDTIYNVTGFWKCNEVKTMQSGQVSGQEEPVPSFFFRLREKIVLRLTSCRVRTPLGRGWTTG